MVNSRRRSGSMTGLRLIFKQDFKKIKQTFTSLDTKTPKNWKCESSAQKFWNDRVKFCSCPNHIFYFLPLPEKVATLEQEMLLKICQNWICKHCIVKFLLMYNIAFLFYWTIYDSVALDMFLGRDFTRSKLMITSTSKTITVSTGFVSSIHRVL